MALQIDGFSIGPEIIFLQPKNHLGEKDSVKPN